MTEHFEPCSKKGRGMAKKSLDLIEAMHAAAKKAHPITGRGIGYKLFTAGLIPSMARAEMQRVYRLLKEARERDLIPWGWIVDETRELERVSTWADPEHYARCVARSYRRDFWDQQPIRVEVWSEKGTVRGVLKPVLDQYAVGFRVMHGFSGATTIYDVSQDDDGRELIALYVGDYDPSGMFMSEEDLPTRLSKYDGDHVTLERIALTRGHVSGLPSFPATDKRKDPGYKWFRSNYGDRCWELDAMDPNDLRNCVKDAIAEFDRARGVGALRDRQSGGTRVAERHPREVGCPMSDEAARKRNALQKIDDLLWEIDDGDVMVIVAALIEHAASTAVTAWGVQEASATVYELLDQALVSEEIFETSDFARAHRAWRKEIGND